MCGIVGYTGPRQAAPIIFEGLRRLEALYRSFSYLQRWSGQGQERLAQLAL